MTEQEHKQLLQDIKEIKETLKPIAETYVAAAKVGTWAKWGLGIVAVIITIILGLKELFKK